MPKQYGETVKLHRKNGHKQPAGCPCGWEISGEFILFTIRKECPTHRLDVDVPPPPPVKPLA